MNAFLIIVFVVFLLVATTINLKSHHRRGNTLNSSDRFITDPDPQISPYVPIEMKKHPKCYMIMTSFLENYYYCKSTGESESSDINSLLYLIYSELRNPGYGRHKCFFNSVVDENISKLAGSLGIIQKLDKCDRFNDAAEIFRDVMSFEKLSPRQLYILGRCFSYITASHMVDTADEMKLKLNDLVESGEDRIATREEIINIAKGIVTGLLPPGHLRLWAAQEKLHLSITCIAMVNEQAKSYILGFNSRDASDSVSIGKMRRKKVILLRYDNFSFAPVFKGNKV